MVSQLRSIRTIEGYNHKEVRGETKLYSFYNSSSRNKTAYPSVNQSYTEDDQWWPIQFLIQKNHLLLPWCQNKLYTQELQITAKFQ
jgi:hypothetical protein